MDIPRIHGTAYKHLVESGFKVEEIKESGLMSGMEKDKVYDRFRNRLMFPVFDYRGRVIGFGARVLDDSKPKYLNSPDTLLFRKGTNLYGLNLFAKNKKSVDDSLIIVEELYGLYYSTGRIPQRGCFL